MEKNQFCENSVFTQNNIRVGSGAVFNMGGTMNTFIESKENIYFMNWAEFKGFCVFINFNFNLNSLIGGIICGQWGVFSDFNSLFICEKSYFFKLF